MEDSTNINKSTGLPFPIRLIGIVVLVSGIFGMLFYLTALIVQLSGQDFLLNIDYKGYSGISFFIVLSIQIILNGGLVISSVLLLNQKKTGFYIFSATFVIMSLLNLLLQGDENIVIPLIGLGMIIIVYLYKGKMN